MATKLEKLFFAIGVQDGASNKVARLQANIANMAKQAGDHFRGIGTAALGLVGAGLSIKAIAGPAVELNRALTEVGALGVDTDGLKVLQNEAGRFAMQYGKDAKEVIRSSVAIQEAVDGLTAKELAAFTTAGNVLAMASRSSVESMTGYMGAMHGIFQAQAGRMGKARWAEQMAGQTEFIARTFKVKGEEIAAGFTALGDKATRAGMEAGEQMAVMAALQKTMGGAAAGDRLKSFAAGAGKAGRQLGLSFTDQKGQLLGMVDVLDTIRAKYGDTLTEAQQLKFAKAFNDKDAGAFINTLLSKQGQLTAAIRDVKTVTDMTGARASARQTTDAFQRFGASVDYVQANFMQKLLPTLSRWTNKASDHLDTLNKWITKYPNVARVVGYCVLAVLSLAGVVALGTMAFHLFKLAGIALGLPFRALITLVKVLSSGFIRLGAIMLANPIVLVLLLVAVAIGVVIYYWQELKAYFADTSWGQPFLWVMECLEEKWNMLTDLFSDFTWTKLLKLVISTALIPLQAFVNTLGEILDYIPGMADEASALKGWKASAFADDLLGADPNKGLAAGQHIAPRARLPEGAGQAELVRMNNPELASLKAGKTLQAPQGGVLGSSLTKVNNSGKTIHIGEQHIHVENPLPNPDDYGAMQFG